MNEKILIYEDTIVVLERSVDRLWQAVENGLYGSRSIVGDEVLNMRDALDDLRKSIAK